MKPKGGKFVCVLANNEGSIRALYTTGSKTYVLDGSKEKLLYKDIPDDRVSEVQYQLFSLGDLEPQSNMEDPSELENIATAWNEFYKRNGIYYTPPYEKNAFSRYGNELAAGASN